MFALHVDLGAAIVLHVHEHGGAVAGGEPGDLLDPVSHRVAFELDARLLGHGEALLHRGVHDPGGALGGEQAAVAHPEQAGEGGQPDQSYGGFAFHDGLSHLFLLTAQQVESVAMVGERHGHTASRLGHINLSAVDIHYAMEA